MHRLDVVHDGQHLGVQHLVLLELGEVGNVVDLVDIGHIEFLRKARCGREVDKRDGLGLLVGRVEHPGAVHFGVELPPETVGVVRRLQLVELVDLVDRLLDRLVDVVAQGDLRLGQRLARVVGVGLDDGLRHQLELEDHAHEILHVGHVGDLRVAPLVVGDGLVVQVYDEQVEEPGVGQLERGVVRGDERVERHQLLEVDGDRVRAECDLLVGGTARLHEHREVVLAGVLGVVGRVPGVGSVVVVQRRVVAIWRDVERLEGGGLDDRRLLGVWKSIALRVVVCDVEPEHPCRRVGQCIECCN